MIPGVRLPAPDRPGFCQTCYCEHCGRGFYDKAKDAVKFSDGRIRCNMTGCDGQVRSTPVLMWQRTTPCRHCGKGPHKLTAPNPPSMAA